MSVRERFGAEGPYDLPLSLQVSQGFSPDPVAEPFVL